MEELNLKELRRIANEIKPQFNIGKNGVTENVIETIDDYLEAHNVVKIKVLSASSKEDVRRLAQEIAEKLDCEIIQKIGFTFVLYRN